MTVVLGGGQAGRDDLDVAALLDKNEANRLEIVRGRSEKWLGALTALSGLITTVLVVKGRESTADIATWAQVAVLVLIGLALALLVFGTYRAYQAAYGDPGGLEEISVQPLTGLAVRYDGARRRAAKAAQGHLGHALVATVAAIVLLASAVGVTWLAPEKASASKSVCLLVNGKTVAKLPGDSLTARQLSAGAELRGCS